MNNIQSGFESNSHDGYCLFTVLLVYAKSGHTHGYYPLSLCKIYYECRK